MKCEKIITLILIFFTISTSFIQIPISIGIDTNVSDSINIFNRKTNFIYESLPWFFNVHFEFINGRFFIWKQPEIDPPDEGFPALILLHGAVQHAWAWFSNSGKWGREQTKFTESALDEGYFVIALDSKRPVWPGPRAWDAFSKEIENNEDLQLLDSILNWLNNSNLNVNVSNVFCVGFSSGAFMCSRIGQTFGSKIKGLVIHSGANVDTLEITWKGPFFNISKPLNISANHPPTLIVHGNKDSLVRIECGLHLFNDLQRAGIDSEILVLENGEHIWLNEFTGNILDWIDSHK